MKSLQFKTTIKCQGCVSTVQPKMDELVGADHWKVDLLSPERILTVEGENITPQQVVDALAVTGYKAETIPA
jgi:copper chaperone CopZ